MVEAKMEYGPDAPRSSASLAATRDCWMIIPPKECPIKIIGRCYGKSLLSSEHLAGLDTITVLSARESSISAKKAAL